MSLLFIAVFETGITSKGVIVEIQTPSAVLSCNPEVWVLWAQWQASPRGCAPSDPARGIRDPA